MEDAIVRAVTGGDGRGWLTMASCAWKMGEDGGWRTIENQTKRQHIKQ